MRGKHTITINGRLYDAVTGLPLEASSSRSSVVVRDDSQSHHVSVSRTAAKHRVAKPQHSKTLRRDIVAKPHGAHDHTAKVAHTHAHVAKSPLVHKFAPHPSGHAVHHEPKDAPSHIVTAVHQTHAAKKPATSPTMSTRELKDHLIATKLAEAQPNTKKPAKKSRFRTPARISSVMAASLAVMLLGGYLSYINMPSLSVRVAASQAGINASYPGYTPSGYSFDGPVAYRDGEVSLVFAANGGTSSYTVVEKRTSCDSQAVLDSHVATKTTSYDVHAQNGLTIYTYGNNAAWVNNGTLYTIEGDAPLGTKQILTIASSL